MRDELIGGTIGTSLSAFGTAMQINETLKTISLIITIIGAIITYLIMPLIAWLKKSKKDNKITFDEMQEGAKIIKNGLNEITNNAKLGMFEEKKKEGK